MAEMTERQREYLLLFAARNGLDRSISEASEVFGVSKPSVLSVAGALERCGMLHKSRFGEMNLTEKGWETIRTQYDQQRTLTRWLMTTLSLTPIDAEHEARRMVVTLRPDTLDKLVERLCPAKKEADVGAAKLLDCPSGLYEVPFRLQKHDSKELSMGHKGFCQPALFELGEGHCAIRLRPKPLHYQPRHAMQMLDGLLDRLWYCHKTVWYEAMKDVEGAFILPGGALRMVEGGGTHTAVLRIRARASVGLFRMPESEADFVFALDDAIPAEQDGDSSATDIT